jgi:hypothetical protein
MLIFAIIFHLIYFLLGYSSFNNIRYLYNYDNDFEFISVIGVHLTAGLVLFIAVVIWLFHYLRNNPFKSFYPVSKNYLRRESLMILVILFFTVTIYHSYEYGKLVKSKQLITGVYHPDDIKTIKQAASFLPYELELFERQNCCDSAAAREKRYKVADANYCGPGNNGEVIYDNTTTEVTTPYGVDVAPYPSTVTDYTKEYSYLYYCSSISSPDASDSDNQVRHQTAKRWLLGNKKDSIKALLNNYIRIANKYKIRHNLDADSLTNLCFVNNFKIENAINDIYYDQEIFPTENSAEFRTLNYAPFTLMGIQNDTFFTISMWEIYGYIALGLSVLLLSFRFTRFKPWIVSVLGTGIVFVIFAIIANMLPVEDHIVYFYLGFTVLCLLKALQLITKQKNKLHAGVWLNWSVFSIAGFIPVIMKLIYDNTGEIKRCIAEYYVVVRPELPIHRWIGANWDLINAGNFVFLLVFFLLVYIPLAYKWQANPSE